MVIAEETATRLEATGVTAHALSVLAPFLDERCRERAHVVIHLSGAHAYGFPSPDSDLDLKAIHLAPTESFLGLHAAKETADQLVTIDGVELDYTSNELGAVLAGVLRGNGNFLERILGTTEVTTSTWHEDLRPLARRSLSRRLAAHYRGFAKQQRGALEQKPTIKKLLYVLRTATTGIHALRSGEIVPNLAELGPSYGVPEVADLIARKQQGERTALDLAEVETWNARLDAILDRLEKERGTSPLPEVPPNEAELDAWLVQVRRDNL